MSTAPKNNPHQGFFIEVGCPGCGGEIEIDSNFFVTKCRHCGSPLRLSMPETPPAYLIPFKLTEPEARFKIDRQLKSLNLPLTGQELVYKQVYYPYWKVDAMLLRCRNRKEKITVHIDDNSGEETVDYKKNTQVSLAPYQISVAASSQIEGVPDSLGIRGQSLKVVPLSNSNIEEDIDILEVRRSPAEVVKTIELSVSRLNTIQLAEFGQNQTKIFYPKTTLLYFPFFIADDYAGEGFRRYLLDGLTGRILSRIDSEEEEEKKEQQDSPKSTSVFELASELSEEFESQSALENLDFEIPDSGLRFEPNDSTLELGTPQIVFGAVSVNFHRCVNCGDDLPTRSSCIYICRNCHELTCLDINMTKKPKVLAAANSDAQDSFFPFWKFRTNMARQLGFMQDVADVVIPAFRMPNFEALYRLSRRMSNALSQIDCAEIDSLDERFAPVDVLPSQAITFANAAFYRYTLEKTNRLPQQELNLINENIDLVFIPFKPEHYFFVDSVLKSVTFEKKIVSA